MMIAIRHLRRVDRIYRGFSREESAIRMEKEEEIFNDGGSNLFLVIF